MKLKTVLCKSPATLYLVECVDSDTNRTTNYLKLSVDGYEKILLGDHKDLIYLMSKWGIPVVDK